MLNFPELENKILKFWQENRIFEKLRKKNRGNPSSRAKLTTGQRRRWSFLDGPITANNPMGVHHAWGRTYKDLFQRFKAMQGFDQRYQNGFDCQGLWVEVEVEKELGFKTKKDIEKYGIDKFVEKCKERVKKYSKIQTEQSIRLGQWMDWENSYYTMSNENNYAIWGFLKKCHEKGYLYKGRDSVPWCPRCGTAISQHEILAEEYKEITHEAVYLKLPIIDKGFEKTYFLVWTTTPWTIPANSGLALNPEFVYGLFDNGSEKLILLKDLAEKILGKEFSLEKTFKGKDLRGLKYEGPFDDLPRVQEAKKENPETFHSVVLDKDVVIAEEGTGVVHIAPGAGEEDFKLGAKEKLPVIAVIDEGAVYLDGMNEFSGKNAKEDPKIILDYLKKYQGGKFLFKTENYTHRYPTCWRCKKELVWRVVDEWYIAMDKPSKSKVKSQKLKVKETLRNDLVKVAKTIKWIPDFGLERELDWLKNMHDWLISKKRYWGLALPIFECEKCGNFEVIGSKEELKRRAVDGWEKFSAQGGSVSGGEGHSPHRPWVDNIKIKCSKCKEAVSRIPDVGNPWLDAGIVPFSTMGYYTEHVKLPDGSNVPGKKYWKQWFPAELVCESFPGQFKNWFYAIITMSAVLENIAPVKTIFGYALVRDEKGEEMHKSKGNAIWFDDAVEKIGADPMRWLYAKQNPEYNLNFGYAAAEEIKRKLLTLYNVFTFFITYVDKKDFPEKIKLSSDNILDCWIISKLNNLIENASKDLNAYNAAGAAVALEDFFVNDLSLWYLRRSRERFHTGAKDRDKAIETLYFVLLNLTKLFAPMMPFFAEEIYQTLKLKDMPESIHLCDWPKADKKKINEKLEEKMKKTKEMVALALAERAQVGIKIRQPIASLKINPAGSETKIKNDDELLNLLKDEVNVKKIIFDSTINKKIELDTIITKELEEEGIKREIIRSTRSLRKELKLSPQNIITGLTSTASVVSMGMTEEELLKEAGAKRFTKVEKESDMDVDVKKVVKIRGKIHHIGLEK